MAFKPGTSIKESKARANLLQKEKGKLAEESAEELLTLEEERIFREGTVSIRDLMAPASFNVESNFLQLGNVYARTIFVIS